MKLAFALLLASAPVAAQGQVHVVDDGAIDRGAVWMLDVAPDGTLDVPWELAHGVSGLGGLHDRDEFGTAIAGIGDLDGNGVPDLAVGAPGESLQRGAVWILFRAGDGSILSQRALRPGRDGLAPTPSPMRFGAALAFLGDLNGDGAPELAVGLPGPAAMAAGEARILSLASDGHALSEVRIGQGLGGFGGSVGAMDNFGSGLGALGDLDGDGVADLAIGAPGRSNGAGRGAIWLLFLSASGTVVHEVEVSPATGGFGSNPYTQGLGSSVCVVGDIDSDGTPDLAIGDANPYTGSLWIVRLNAGFTASAVKKLEAGINGFQTTPYRGLGASVAPLGDRDGDGVPDLAAGAPGNATTAISTVFLLLLNADGTVKSRLTLDGQIPGHAAGDRLGAGLASLGDLDLDGRLDLAAGASAREGVPEPSDYTSLQLAIGAAAQGDTLLLRDGRYAPAIVNGKSLNVVGDHGFAADGVEHRIEVDDLTVRNLAASQSIVLSDLAGRVSLENVDGLAWIEELDGAGLHVGDCADVVLLRSTLRGLLSLDALDAEPSPGLDIVGDSAVYAYDCLLVGGDGWCELSLPIFAHAGSPGAETRGTSSLFLSGCSLQGGTGVSCSDPFLGLDCAPGGDGLWARSPGPVRVLDSQATGGPAGNGCGAGQAYEGPVEHLGGRSLAFTSDSPAREGEDVTYSFQGPPDTPVWLIGGPSVRIEPWANGVGPLLVGTPRVFAYMGTTDASGALTYLNPLGLLPPTWEVRRLFLQPLMIEPGRGGPGGKLRAETSRVTLGAGSAFLVLDSSF